MNATRLRKVGQAMTALSAVIIAYATLNPSAGGGPSSDELVHFLLFIPLGMGGALWMAVLEPAQQRRVRLAILVLVLVFAAATELAQVPMDDRSGSLTDFVADAAGAGVGVLAGSWLALRSHREAR